MRSNLPFIILLLLAVFFAACCAEEGPQPPENFEVWGIDVSRYQKDIDWNTVQQKNCPYFVILKATEGMLITDPMYDIRSRELDKRGIARGAYHFFGHRTPGSEQAAHFISTAKLGKGNIIPVLDIEWHKFMKDPDKMVSEAKEFCRAVKKHYGVNPIIYCSTHFYERYLKKDFPAGKYILWIADYRGEPTEINWTIWQHTDGYRMNGSNGSMIDRNVFNGKAADLKKIILK